MKKKRIARDQILLERLSVFSGVRMWTYSMPCEICLAISILMRSSNFVSNTCKCLYREEPSHHCVTIASLGLDTQPINNNIFTCLKQKHTILTYVALMMGLLTSVNPIF